MCTVSIVASPGRIRVVCNRDEQRTRAEAVPPQQHSLAGCQALFPLDPIGGGTWVGVNEHGLIAALLNRSTAPDLSIAPTQRLVTRGTIVPQLLAANTIDDAVAHAVALPPQSFASFRVVLVQDADLWIVDGGAGLPPRVQTRLTATPTVFSSSSLGDHLVEGPRARLFDELLLRKPLEPLVAQAILHSHHWRHCPELSVLMSRPDAQTVSRTCIDVNYEVGNITMRYEPIRSVEGWALAC